MRLKRISFLLLPALTMSVGWGLRGFIGGGPLGAMIPGALTALALALLLGRKGDDAARIAAFGAVAIGLGGQETYGQTIGLSFQPATQWWGLLGLTIKGLAWGLAGGALLAVAFQPRRWHGHDLVIGLLLLCAATHLGWKLINEPKLIYFSNLHDRPRAELYAGQLLGGLAFLAWLWRQGDARLPSAFALYGAVGGGTGFGLGGWIQVVGRASGLESGVGWWKVMEFTFGLLLGLSFGLFAWRNREALLAEPALEESPSGLSWGAVVAGLVGGLLLFFAEEHFPLRWNYTLAGAGLLAAVLAWRKLAWQVAITCTYCAFAIDLLENKPGVPWAFVIATTAMMAWLAARPLAERAQLLLLLWTAVAVAAYKLFGPPPAPSLHAVALQSTFTLLATATTVLVLRH